MEIEKELIGKKIKIRTKTGKIVTGIVKGYENDLIKILDIFNMIVYVFEKDVALLEEKR